MINIDLPLISVITVVYNDVSNLEQTILSVVNQTYKNIEYIIIDGGSTDGTVDIIKKYEKHLAYWSSKPDSGIYYAMNKGIDRATGEWINFMNSGDIFTDCEVLQKVFFENIPKDIDVIYGNSTETDKNFIKTYKKAKVLPNKFLPLDYRHGASFVKSSVHKSMKFDLSKVNILGYALDYNFIFKLYKKGGKFLYKDIDMMIYLKEGISNNRLKNVWFRVLVKHDAKKNICFWMDFAKTIMLSVFKKL